MVTNQITKTKRSLPIFVAGATLALAVGGTAKANMVIVPTFNSSITGDINAAAIEGTINTAIAIYENTFSDPVTVNITFGEGGGLGESEFSLFSDTYSDFHAHLIADAKTADDATMLARLALDGSGTSNPVTGTSTVLFKSANAKALGYTGLPSNDGTILLNTSITTPGSPGSTQQYSLLATTEHEIDEIMGLGSTLGLGLPLPFNNDPSPEDFVRFDGSGNRSFTSSGSALSYFSINGTTDLAQFDNQNDGGDFGDWQSNPLPPATPYRVQDAFAYPGTAPTLGVELQALDVIGWDRITDVLAPEPATLAVLGIGTLGLISARRKRS